VSRVEIAVVAEPNLDSWSKLGIESQRV
jgi:hypothetical protein